MDKPTIEERFLDFHERNPQVFDLFIRYALQLKRKGKRGGAKLILERIRWEMATETDSLDFKINNDFSSRYARLAMDSITELEGYFETRRLTA